MMQEYWQRQTADKPLFPELEWSRPENRLHAGKLLIVGGNVHEFAAPAEAYGAAEQAGIGSIRTLLPEALRKTVGAMIPEADFAPSTPSGSLSQKALGELLAASAWADGVLVAGDLGRNSETAILLESFLAKYKGPAVFAKDAVDYIASAPEAALNREGTLVVLSLSQLQRLGLAAKFPQAVTFSMDLLHLAEWLHEFTAKHRLFILVKHHEYVLAAANGQVSSTRSEEEKPIWRVKTAATAAVWWLQHPNKQFEALSASVLTATEHRAE